MTARQLRLQNAREAAADAYVSSATDRLDDPLTQPTYWPVDTSVLADAHQQSRPFAGDTSAEDRAWAARVDSAVHGMDAVDPDGLDTWMQTHAEAEIPHLHEADLVAVWETIVRDAYDLDAVIEERNAEAFDAKYDAQFYPEYSTSHDVDCDVDEDGC